MDFAVCLLFLADGRPDAPAIRALAKENGQFSISIDPEDDGPTNWLELLANGLTFDVSGLSPGPAESVSTSGQRFGLDRDFSAEGLESIAITPGPHLVGGGAMVPIVRCMAWLAAQLVELPSVQAVVWSPANTTCSPEYFRESVMRWISGGPFPGLGLTGLVPQADGSLLSEGLALFTGQELRVAADLAQDRSEGAKIALRMIHWLVENGRVRERLSLTGPSGETLLLEPDDNLGIVKVWRGSR